ncbi:MAG: segregation and condensation protein B [Parcubacteria group bacterium Gr01-1014_56]|nr:MAG: segregation and condensation protein B [Parcubacteria group bacterium Gr01-1014_56]
MNNQGLGQQIEALLFALGRPLARKELIEKLGCSAEDLELAIKTLVVGGDGRGVVCVDDGRTLELRISSKDAELVERVRKEELSRDIGRAGLETLSAILYRGPLTRSEIDFIRGVNSSQILRTLLVRGLVRRITNPKDERSFLYEPTTELMAQLGTVTRDSLPDFAHVRSRLVELEEAYRLKNNDSNE